MCSRRCGAMSTGTMHDAARSCRGFSPLLATARWMRCGGAGAGGARPSGGSRRARRGRTSTPRPAPTRRRCRDGRCTARWRRRWISPLAAAAALLVVLAGAGSAYWASRTIGALKAERDTLSARLAALEDTVNSFIYGTATRLVQVPVSTGGRLGAVTIFADGAHHRWLVRCDGLAPNEPDQAYQLWFITDKGMRTAAIMPMDQDRSMVMALEMPA